MHLFKKIAFSCLQILVLAKKSSAANSFSVVASDNVSIPALEAPAARSFEEVEHHLNISFWFEYNGGPGQMRYAFTIHTVPEYRDTHFYCNDDWEGNKWYDFRIPPWHGLKTRMQIRFGNICRLNKDPSELWAANFETTCVNCYDRAGIKMNNRIIDVPKDCFIANMWSFATHGLVEHEARCRLHWTAKKETKA